MGAKQSKGDGDIRDTGATGSSCACVQAGLKGVCQDSIIAMEALIAEPKVAMVGAFDGHGHKGHAVSAFVRDELPLRLRQQLEGRQEELQLLQQQQERSPASAVKFWAPLVESAFADVDSEVEKKLPSTDSGSTAVIALRLGSKLVVAHAGDSRCVLGRTKYDASNTNGRTYNIVPLQLTNDHKAGDPGEKERVHAAGGKVMKWMNTIDRLFVPGKNEPGLAVTRAFGDFDLKGHGLTSTPVVKVHDIAPADEFIVLASDGVWDVLSNEDVVGTVWQTKQRTKAAKAVVQKTMAAWASSSGGRNASMRDDISVVIYFF